MWLQVQPLWLSNCPCRTSYCCVRRWTGVGCYCRWRWVCLYNWSSGSYGRVKSRWVNRCFSCYRCCKLFMCCSDIFPVPSQLACVSINYIRAGLFNLSSNSSRIPWTSYWVSDTYIVACCEGWKWKSVLVVLGCGGHFKLGKIFTNAIVPWWWVA